MAGEAEHQQVVLAVVAALDDAKPVMDVELTLRAGRSTVLAVTAASSDQPAAAGRGELGRSGAAIVGLAEALARRGLAEQGREGAGEAGRTGAAADVQVGGGSRTGFVDSEEVEDPGPFQAARLARSPAAAQDSRSST